MSCRTFLLCCVALLCATLASSELHAQKVNLQAASPDNWALAQRATQSSIGKFCGVTLDQPCYPEYAVNGDFNQNMNNVAPYTAAHTDITPSPHFWRVDLGAQRPIGQITLYLRKDCCLERNAMSVWVSTDEVIANATGRMPNGWTVGGVPQASVYSSPNQIFQINIQPPIYARHVELRSTAWVLTVAEVVVSAGAPVCSVNNGGCGSPANTLCTTSALGSNQVVCQCMAGFKGTPCQPQSRFTVTTTTSRDWQPLTRASLEHVHPIGLHTWEPWFDCKGSSLKSTECNFDIVRSGDTNSVGIVTLTTPLGAQPGKFLLDFTAKIAVSYGYTATQGDMPSITFSLVNSVNDTKEGDVLNTVTPVMSNYPMFDSCNMKGCFSDVQLSVAVPAGHGSLDTPKFLRLTVNNGKRHNLNLLVTSSFMFHVDQRSTDPCFNNGNCGPTDTTQCIVSPLQTAVCKCREFYDGAPPAIACQVINKCSVNNGGCGSNATTGCAVDFNSKPVCTCLNGFMGNAPQLPCSPVQQFNLIPMRISDWVLSGPASIVHIAPLGVAADERTCRVPFGAIQADWCDYDYLASGSAFDDQGSFTLNFPLAAQGKIISAIKATLLVAYSGTDQIVPNPAPKVRFTLVNNVNDRFGDNLGEVTPLFSSERWPLLMSCSAAICFQPTELVVNTSFSHGSLSTPKFLRLTIDNGKSKSLAMLPVPPTSWVPQSMLPAPSFLLTYANAPTVNDCASNNGGCGHWSTSSCKPDVEGHAICSCQEGYAGAPPTRICAPVNLCETNNGGCGDSAVCSLDRNRHKLCKCQAGSTGQPPEKPCKLNSASALDDAAVKSGRFFGAAVTVGDLDKPEMMTVLKREFNVLTPASEFLWDAVEPSQNAFNFDPAIRLSNYAQAAGMKVRGGALITPTHLPNWVQQLPADQMTNAIKAHVGSVVNRFGDAVFAWDVVSEAFTESGLVPSPVLRFNLIDTAFTTARIAVPSGVKLCLNDVGIEARNAKSDLVYNTLKSMLARGVPIDCVGFATRIKAGGLHDSFQSNMQRFAELGLDVHITQLEVAGGDENLQAKTFASVVKACAAVSRCVGITTWGVGDANNANNKPLLFDVNWKPKAAYTSALVALNGVSTTVTLTSATLADWIITGPASVERVAPIGTVPVGQTYNKCTPGSFAGPTDAYDYMCNFDYIKGGEYGTTGTSMLRQAIPAHPYQYITSISATLLYTLGHGTQPTPNAMPVVTFSIFNSSLPAAPETVIGTITVPSGPNPLAYFDVCNARPCFASITLKVDTPATSKPMLDTAMNLRVTVKNQEHNLQFLPSASFAISLSAPVSKSNGGETTNAGSGASSTGALAGIAAGAVVVIVAVVAAVLFYMKRKAATKSTNARTAHHLEVAVDGASSTAPAGSTLGAPGMTCAPPTPRSAVKRDVEMTTVSATSGAPVRAPAPPRRSSCATSSESSSKVKKIAATQSTAV